MHTLIFIATLIVSLLICFLNLHCYNTNFTFLCFNTWVKWAILDHVRYLVFFYVVVGVSTPSSKGVNMDALGDDECDAPTNSEIAVKEMEALEAIKEDICKWLSVTLHIELTPPALIEELDNGVLLCRLASLIQQAAGELEQHNKLRVNIPMRPVNYSEKAESSSFLARDNTSNFIEWCRKLGIEEAVIFESEGLVLHKDEKRVILCLLDVARFAERVGISPPQLVRMEREIEQLDSGMLPAIDSHEDGRSTSRSEDGQERKSSASRSVIAKKVLPNCLALHFHGTRSIDTG